MEKTTQGGRKIDKHHIDSFDLATLRKEGPEYVSRKLFAAQKGTVIVVNAADEADMDVVVLGVLQGEFPTSHAHPQHVLFMSLSPEQVCKLNTTNAVQPLPKASAYSIAPALPLSLPASAYHLFRLSLPPN